MPVGVMVEARGVLEINQPTVVGVKDDEGLVAVGIAGSPALPVGLAALRRKIRFSMSLLPCCWRSSSKTSDVPAQKCFDC